MTPLESQNKILTFPAIPGDILAYWQEITQTVAELLDVSAVFIQCITDSQLEIVAANPSPENPFRVGDVEAFATSSSYSAAVVEARESMQVPNASVIARWSDDIAVNKGMLSFFGLPVFGGDKKLFGTICVLDKKVRHFSNSQQRLIEHYRDLVEQQLAQLQADKQPKTDQLAVGQMAPWQNSLYLLQAVMDGATDAIFLKDLNGRFLLYNQAAANVTGRRVEDVVGALTEDIFEESISKKLREYDAEVVRTGQPQTIKEHILIDGSMRIFLATRSPYRDEAGNVIGIIGIARDITEAQRVEEEYRIQRERLSLAAQVCELGIWDYHIEADRLHCDAQWHQILGFEELGKIQSLEDFKAYIHPDDVVRATEIDADEMQKLIAQNQPHRNDFRIIRPNGDTRWVRSASILIHTESGEPDRSVGMIMDITEARMAEEQLRNSYEFLQRAEKLARIGSWLLDIETGKYSASDMLLELSDFDPKGMAFTFTDLKRLYPSESFEKISEAISNCLKTGESFGIEVEHLRLSGPSFPVYIQGQAHRNEAGKITHLSGTVQDITEIAEAKKRLAAVTDNLPNGAVYRIEYDSRGRASMVYMSAGILSLVGVPADEIIEDINAFTRLVHEEDLAHYRALGERARATREACHSRFRVRTPGGKIVWLEFRAVMSSSRADGSTVWDGILRDVTGEQEAAAALRNAKEIAEKAEQAKSEFLATMSHEIRTPMNTVIGMTRLMMQTDLTPKQRNYLKKVDASAKLLLSIINDILDFSKIEAGCLELEITDFTLESMLESVSAATAPRAEEKGIEIAYEIKPTVSRALKGDPLRLCQVLINLIGNAVKFTDKGEVIVTVDTKLENNISTLCFAVRDTGIGMDPLQITSLFRPFSQADPQTARHYGGTGLGLTISKHIVESMGGTIHVESEPGKGSTFHFAIPQDKKPIALPERAIYFPRELNGRRVLIIEDNASTRRILTDMVVRFGIEVESVDSGEKGLELLRQGALQGHPFDLVLLDWQMPTMDGLETARRIRDEKSLHEMPAVLMVTAFAREEVQQGVEALGLQGLLAKPITESVLFNGILDALIYPHSAVARIDALGGAIRPEIAPSGTFELLADRRVLVVDDNALNREVASDFLLAAGMQVDTAVDGLDALQHLEQNDYDVVLMDIHMPKMDGLTATREIRQHQRWADLPIIALTAQARVEDREASLKAGMTRYLTKPIDEAALYATLAQIFEPSADALLSNSSNLALSSGDEEDRGSTHQGDFNLAAATKRLGNNPHRMWRLLQGFLTDFADVPQQMELHLHTGNVKQITYLAHLAKGAASYLDAHEFCHLAEMLEQAGRQDDLKAINEHGPRFVHSLQTLLVQLKEVATESAQTEAPDLAPALELVTQVEPLVAQGEYAAQALLDRIDIHLKGSEWSGLVSEILSQYEDLELELAVASLQQLKGKLDRELQKHE